MIQPATPPNTAAILDGLKDFQQNTVEYVFRRLYLDECVSNRFLVADEVGLGKTLIARGVIAKAIEYLWDRVDRIDIVYICSNADIARQNIKRLNVSGGDDFSLASRITLLPLELHNLQQRKVNFISFTPGTSFEQKSSLGLAKERLLLFSLLEEAWGFQSRAGAMNVLEGGMNRDRFREQVKSFKSWHQIDASLAEAFRQQLSKVVIHQHQAGIPDIYTRFQAMSQEFAYIRSSQALSPEQRRERTKIVGELRQILAKACLSALEPDLIILDEFQRFKHLLEAEDEVGELANEMFTYSSESASVKLLLLSATPYKMYTMDHESEEDNHYEDFLRTIRFLQSNEQKNYQFEQLLQQYRNELIRIQNENIEKLLEIKSQIESQLRQVMVRTEKLADSYDRDGMLAEVSNLTARLEPQDIESYVHLYKIVQVLEQGDSLEYWKSAPYLLNFMEHYDLKRSFEKVLSTKASELATALRNSQHLLLSTSQIKKYREIDPCNPRLRSLFADVIGSGMWKLLWMPPALSYYQLNGVYAEVNPVATTKRLIFSSWHVVPKAISALLSYEVERRMLRSLKKRDKKSPNVLKQSGRLRFGLTSDGRNHPTGLPVLALLYPSTTLARECDPLHFAVATPEIPTLAQLQDSIESRIRQLLDAIGYQSTNSDRVDENWYWAAPILLDLHHDRAATLDWFNRPQLAQTWKGIDFSNHEESTKNWAIHVNHARQLLFPSIRSLGKPPEDLVQVLAQFAIASPGITALRALSRVTGSMETPIRDRAAQIAWAFRTLFNQPSVTVFLKSLTPDLPYWRSVLQYCVNGALQATLDEYVHVLGDSTGVRNQDSNTIAETITQTICEALSLRTSALRVDNINAKHGSVSIEHYSMRAHFALRFGNEDSENDKTVNRKAQVLKAFNSPFYPFVLASTSIGQEGLDFHNYCHAIVHWNLPSNPVDLEQREGRVHRYKGHAVRKNLALQYGVREFENSTDPWQCLFIAGKRDRAPDANDLVPFWIYPIENGAKIERHVPHLPLSRDSERLMHLKQSLMLYRMVFGQSRQEDLMAYLSRRISLADVTQLVQRLQIRLAPPSTSSPLLESAHKC